LINCVLCNFMCKLCHFSHHCIPLLLGTYFQRQGLRWGRSHGWSDSEAQSNVHALALFLPGSLGYLTLRRLPIGLWALLVRNIMSERRAELLSAVSEHCTSWARQYGPYTSPAAEMTAIVRKPDLICRLFYLAGVALFLFGIWKLAHG
jgi:hypothetical protein